MIILKDNKSLYRCFKNTSNDVIYFEIKLYLDYKYALDLCTNYYRFLNYQDNNEKFKKKIIMKMDIMEIYLKE